MLRSTEAEPGCEDSARQTAPAVRAARATWPALIRLKALVDAWSDGLAGCRDYERLRSHGVSHDEALREAFGLTASPPLDPAEPLHFAAKA